MDDIWVPQYAKWRHGGWYVTNVRYPSGAVGCVSRNYPDRKWRIACDPRPDGHYYTYPNRDAAARAEKELVDAIPEEEGGTRRYHVRLASGRDERVEGRNDALERVKLGLAVGWWSGKPFEGRELERGLRQESEKWVGKTVNMGGKSGGLWERVTITAYERGEMILEGGHWIRDLFADEPLREPLDRFLKQVYPHDVARGIVYADYEVPE
jgi:hypothetical protein